MRDAPENNAGPGQVSKESVETMTFNLRIRSANGFESRQHEKLTAAVAALEAAINSKRFEDEVKSHSYTRLESFGWPWQGRRLAVDAIGYHGTRDTPEAIYGRLMGHGEAPPLNSPAINLALDAYIDARSQVFGNYGDFHDVMWINGAVLDTMQVTEIAGNLMTLILNKLGYRPRPVKPWSGLFRYSAPCAIAGIVKNILETGAADG